MAAIAWFLLSAAFVDLVGYWLHRWAHRPSSPLYRPHMTHHVVKYPPKRFTTTVYESSGVDSLAIWFAPFGIAYGVLILLAGLPAVPILLGGAVTALLNSLLHDLSHVEGSVAWRFLPGLCERHRTHHRKMGRNFGILSSAWDRLFRTWLPASASRPRHPPSHPGYH